MRLESVDGAVVELRPVAYEFSEAVAEASPLYDWDANWLRIEGSVRLADGRSWSFADPSLIVDEARELGVWLSRVRDDDVDPIEPEGDDERLCRFTEPNLAFSLAARDESEVTLRVHLSLECRPPWMDPSPIYEYAVDLRLPRAALARAISQWETDLAPFPTRHQKGQSGQ